MSQDIGFYMFGAMDEIISSELNVDIETYTDVLDNRCTYSEGKFIIFSLLSDREDKKAKAIELFNSKLK
jgi:hypothetical protein